MTPPNSRHHRLGLGALFVFVVATLTLVPPERVETQAESPPGPAPDSVEASGRQLSPVPAYRLFPPKVLKRLAARARSRLWQIPDSKTWPTDEQGRPIVETKRAERLRHTVQPGETIDRICDKYRTTRRRLAGLNPATDLGSLEPGDTLLVWERGSEVSVSYGASDLGSLFHAKPLPPDDDYEILFLHRTFGTYYTVSETRRVLTDYYDHYPKAHKLMIGDISFRDGGAIYPHTSHQSGRDIDISYPRRDEPPTLRMFNDVDPHELAVDQTFFLLKGFLDGGYVEHVFMARAFQELLYREAERRGAPKRWLERVFEYPDWGYKAIVQHSPGHRNHLHIRFHCQPTDRRCR